MSRLQSTHSTSPIHSPVDDSPISTLPSSNSDQQLKEENDKFEKERSHKSKRLRLDSGSSIEESPATTTRTRTLTPVTDKSRKNESNEKDRHNNNNMNNMNNMNNNMKSDGDNDDNSSKRKDNSSRIPVYLPALQGCRSVDEYERLNQIEEGSYGVVFRAKDKTNNKVYALKRLKMEREKEGFPITSLREIDTLLKSPHPNIVNVREIVVGSSMDKIYLVMEFVEHDLKTLMSSMRQPFTIGEVKTLMLHLLSAVAHMHDNWIIHRDLKTSNLLLSNSGVLKVADFGLAREYGSPIHAMTPLVVTLWYRAPELLLGETKYTTAVDMWSVGCIFGEFLTHTPLFQGDRELTQLRLIFELLGRPNDTIWPNYSHLPNSKLVNFPNQPYNCLKEKVPHISDTGFHLLNDMLTYDPRRRLTAERALQSPYFKENPRPVDPGMFPSWPAKSELVKVREVEKEPKAPEGYSEFGANANTSSSSSSSSSSSNQQSGGLTNMFATNNRKGKQQTGNDDFVFETEEVYRLLKQQAPSDSAFKLKF